MNDDLEKILALLKKRFPRSEPSIMGSGDGGSNPIAEVKLFSVGDAIWAVGDAPDKGMTVGMGVSQHVDNEDFKPDGYDLFSFQYQGPEHLVEKFVEGANAMLKKLEAFEKEENDSLAEYGQERGSWDPELAPALGNEIQAGSTNVVVEWEREIA